MATAGDVNGDGFADVIVGASGYDNGQTDEGRAFVYHGSAAGLATTAAWTAESDQANARFGSSVATAGDVNGDGFSDVIVGAYAYDNGQTDEGRAFVYHGLGGGLSQRPPPGPRSRTRLGAEFGFSVATAGDVNGDGYSDVIVGATSLRQRGDQRGASVRLPRLGGGALARLPPGQRSRTRTRSLRLFGGDGWGRERGRLLGRDRRRPRLRRRPELDEGQAFVYMGQPGAFDSPAGLRKAIRQAPILASRWGRRGT